MPDTWTPIFDLSDAEEVKKINQQADLHIQDVVNRVVEKREGDFSQRRLPRIVAGLARENYNRARMTRHLHVTDACIGCGLCMRNCPVQAIEMRDKKPVWVKEQCLMCLRCLHHCPKFAIQYDDRTQEHGQYVHP